ncbi:MAG: FHA domain-containing protein [Planctomycetaceae bacterium]
MSEVWEKQLQRAIGISSPLRIRVDYPDGTHQELELDRPCAVVGRGTGCDIFLNHETVSFRHAYLQVLAGRVACFDLFSINGVRIPGETPTCWMTPGVPVQIGEPKLTLLPGVWRPPLDALPSPFDARVKEDQRSFGILPEVELVMANKSLQGVSWPINRALSFVGRDERCRITCVDERVSRIHCALLLLPSGLWVVDLLGKGGTWVNEQQTSGAWLGPDSLLRIGQYQMQVHYRSEPAALPPPSAQSVAFQTKQHEVFIVEWDGDTLIVNPQGESGSFRYQSLQLESNAVLTLLKARGFRNLVVDFSRVHVVGSIILEAVSQFCRATGGVAVLCGASEDQAHALRETHLTSLWPLFSTREEAVRKLRRDAKADPPKGN